MELPGQPVKRGTMAHEHIVFSMLLEAAAQAADETALRACAPRLEQLAERDQHGPYLGVAHRAWGMAHRLAGEHKLSEQRLNKALGLFEAIPAPWQVGRTREQLALLAIDQSDPATARDHLTAAQSAYDELGAAPDLIRVQRMLETLT